MKTSTASYLIYGTIGLGFLFSSQIKQAYNDFTTSVDTAVVEKIKTKLERIPQTQNFELKINSQNPQITKQSQTQQISQKESSINNNLMSSNQLVDCLVYGQEFGELKNYHSQLKEAAEVEFEDNQIYHSDYKEIKSDLKKLYKKIDDYQNTLDSFWQPVPDHQVDEYNRFVNKKNNLVRQSWNLEEDFEDVQNLMNQAAENHDNVRTQMKSTSNELKLVGDKLTTQCLGDKKVSALSLQRACRGEENNYFCNAFNQ